MAETPFSPEHQENEPTPQPWTTEPAETMADAVAPAPVTVTPDPEPEPILAGHEPLGEPDSETPAPVTEAPTLEVAPEPGIVATLEVPPLEGSTASAGEGGGEFDLLLQKIKDWLGSGELQAQWQRFRGPLKGLAILIGVVLLLRVYASLIGTIDSLPLVGGLLELVGLIAAIRFGASRLVRKSDRDQVLADWTRRWNDFRGRE